MAASRAHEMNWSMQKREDFVVTMFSDSEGLPGSGPRITALGHPCWPDGTTTNKLGNVLEADL